MSAITNGKYEFSTPDESDLPELNQVADRAAQFAVELTGIEVASLGGNITPISLDQVTRADIRVAHTGVIEKLRRWRLEDSGQPGVGGRPAIYTDRIILIALLLLVTEKTPQWISELNNLLTFRLTPDARRYLGLPPGPTTPGTQTFQEKKNGYDTTRNTFQRLLKPMDPYPQRRFLLDVDDRRCVLATLDAARVGVCKTRLNWFSNAFLNMSFMMQSREVRRADKIMNISFDQTYVAPIGLGSYTPAGDAKKQLVADLYEKPTTRDEKKALNMILGERGVLEVFAGFHISNAEKRGTPEQTGIKSTGTGKKGVAAPPKPAEMNWGWAANIAVRSTPDPSKPTPFPLVVMAFTMSIPGVDVTEEAVVLMESVVSYGHTPGYAAADNQYWANSTIDRLHRPASATGFKALSRFRVDRLGIQGGYAGAQQIEGAHYCPAMPAALKTASQDHAAGHIDSETLHIRIDGRANFALRNKERPAADGSVNKMCPAHGIGATVTCPIRAIHPNASKKSKPAVLNRDIPARPDRICTQTSVKFTGEEDLRYSQVIPYGTKEHKPLITTARNSAEGSFGQMKNTGYEGLSAAGRRSSRGFAAAQVFVTMLLVIYNLRHIAAFQNELNIPSKTYTPQTSVFYVPYIDKRKMMRGEKMAAALAMLKPVTPDPPERS